MTSFSAADRQSLFPVLALDISATRIGLAIADHAEAPPQALFTYQRVTRTRDLAQCAEWVRRYGCHSVVIGWPLNMDGTAGERARWMERFAGELGTRITAPVFLQDERLSTVEADEILHARGVGGDKRAAQVDAVAAALILQWFLAEGPTRSVSAEGA